MYFLSELVGKFKGYVLLDLVAVLIDWVDNAAFTD